MVGGDGIVTWARGFADCVNLANILDCSSLKHESDQYRMKIRKKERKLSRLRAISAWRTRCGRLRIFFYGESSLGRTPNLRGGPTE